MTAPEVVLQVLYWILMLYVTQTLVACIINVFRNLPAPDGLRDWFWQTWLPSIILERIRKDR